MSLLPFLLEMERPRRHHDQNFALSLTPEDILTIVAAQPSRNYYRPAWKHMSSVLQDSGSTIRNDKDKFQINVDVQHFAPEDITVKTSDGFLVIEARHEEKLDDHGWVSRQFTRRYELPDGCDANAVQSRLSSDGVLTVTAPLVRSKAADERIVPIVYTGPVKTQSDGAKAENGEEECKNGTAVSKNGEEEGETAAAVENE